MSVIFGTAMAVTVGNARFNLPLFLASLFAMAVLHTGSNMLNDVFDYKKGIDRRVNPVSGAVVRGWITPRQALRAALLLLTAGTTVGLAIAFFVGLPVLLLGLLGVVVGVIYTWGPLPLKFNALGDLAVFLNFGVLGSLGAWTVQTGTPALAPALWAVPISLLVVAILHANNWRDIRSDRAAGIKTMAGVLGDNRSETYYNCMLLLPFAIVLLLLVLSWADLLQPRMPLTFLITFGALFKALPLIKKGRNRETPRNPHDFVALDGDTARLNLLFGLLSTAALGLSAVLDLLTG